MPLAIPYNQEYPQRRMNSDFHKFRFFTSAPCSQSAELLFILPWSIYFFQYLPGSMVHIVCKSAYTQSTHISCTNHLRIIYLLNSAVLHFIATTLVIVLVHMIYSSMCTTINFLLFSGLNVLCTFSYSNASSIARLLYAEQTYPVHEAC